ncbi:MAG: hypothetical protein ACI84O_000559 [Myxococcota bacterium]|jgi:hypothetical protein
MLRSSLILCLSFFAVSCNEQLPDKVDIVIDDLDVDLSRKNFKAWFEQVYPSGDELNWRILGWQLDAAAGFLLAAQSRRPLLLWLEDGHPMGATSEHGRELRQALSDDSLVNWLSKYSLATDDFNRTLDVIDVDEGQLAVYLPDGTLLASEFSTEPQELLIFLTTTLEEYESLTDAERNAELAADSLNDLPRAEDDFPDDGLGLEAFKRTANSLVLDEFEPSVWGKDFIWFNADELQKFVNPIKISSKKNLSNELTHRIVQSFGLQFKAEDVHKPGLLFRCTSIRDSRSTYLISGTVNYQNSDGILRVKAQGSATYDSSANQFEVLEMIVLGEYVNSANDMQLFATALRKVTSLDGWHRVPPSNLADYSNAYYSSASGKPNK